MRKQIVPTFFDTDAETYVRLEYFKDDNLVDRATLKVEKQEQEQIKRMFEDYKKEDIEEEFHYFVLDYIKKNWKKGKKFEIIYSKPQESWMPPPELNQGEYKIFKVEKYFKEAKLGNLTIYFISIPKYDNETNTYQGNPPTWTTNVIAGNFLEEGLSQKTLKEIEYLINNYDCETRDGMNIPRKQRLKEIMENEL